MNWNNKFEAEIEDEKMVEEVLPLEATTVPVQTGYVAVVGISFDKHGVRVEAGEDVPPEYLVDEFVFDWLLNKRGAIKRK